MEPTLRQLQYLIAVAETLSFSRAAEKCHVSQPALSTQIQQLERIFGIQLFERAPRHVRLTDAAHTIVDGAREIVEATEALMETAKASSEPLTGTLSLGVIPTVAPYLLPRLMPAIHEAYPELRLLLREEQTDVLLERLEQGELDLLLLALEADLGDVRTMPLIRDPFLFVAARNHPLARRKCISQDDLAETSLMLLEDGHCLRHQVLAVCHQTRAEEVDDFRASSLNTLLRMVESGWAATLIPKLAEATELGRGEDVVVLPFSEPSPSRTLGFAWRRSSPRTGEYRLLAELVRRAAPPGCVSV